MGGGARRCASATLSALALLPAACGPREQAAPHSTASGTPASGPRTWPSDTVLAVDGDPISRAEVARVARWIEELYPQNSAEQNERRALTHLVLPRAAAACARASERARALEEARAFLERLAKGGESLPAEPRARSARGTWGQLGLEVWGPAHELQRGVWSGPQEGVGRWLLVRVDEAQAGRELGDLVLSISLVEFPYMPPQAGREDLEHLIDERQLTIVDPTWKDIVPLDWQYRMRGPRP